MPRCVEFQTILYGWTCFCLCSLGIASVIQIDGIGGVCFLFISISKKCGQPIMKTGREWCSRRSVKGYYITGPNPCQVLFVLCRKPIRPVCVRTSYGNSEIYCRPRAMIVGVCINNFFGQPLTLYIVRYRKI